MKKGEKRKQELLKIAYRMFVEKGYDSTSIDEIIAEAGIAKGTYYYYFPSKEATLEAVIDMMIDEEVGRARAVVEKPMPVPEKAAAVIYAFRPGQGEKNIADAVEAEENIILHEKLNQRLISEAVPLLSEVVREGIAQGIFACEQIEERVRMILIVSARAFDGGSVTESDVTVFIDMVEKMFGAAPGTMGFVRGLIAGGENHELPA
jgi:Transcriptional regulator